MTTRTRASRVSVRIADVIKRDIDAGVLHPGDRLPPERAMVKRHRVSRVSVREAYRALQDAGVVTVRRGSTGGAFITAPDPAQLSEAMSLAVRLDEAPDRQVREASLVEPLVAALAARHATAEDLARLRKIVSVPSREVRAGRFEQQRVRFHLAVAACAHNVVLAAVVTSLARTSAALFTSIERSHQFIAVSRQWHRRIHDAIARADEIGASREMQAYYVWLNDSSMPSGSVAPQLPTGLTSSALTPSAA